MGVAGTVLIVKRSCVVLADLHLGEPQLYVKPVNYTSTLIRLVLSFLLHYSPERVQTPD